MERGIYETGNRKPEIKKAGGNMDENGTAPEARTAPEKKFYEHASFWMSVILFAVAVIGFLYGTDTPAVEWLKGIFQQEDIYITVNGREARESEGGISKLYLSESNLSTYNTKLLRLNIVIAGAKDNAGLFHGYYPSDDLSVEVALFNYKTGEQIGQTKMPSINKSSHSVEFSDLEDGTYYYTVRCKGYKVSLPNTPFVLKNDKSASSFTENITLNAFLEERNAIYGKPFHVQLVNPDHSPVVNMNNSLALAATQREDQAIDLRRWSYSTDSSGYVRRNNILQEFQILPGCDFRIAAVESRNDGNAYLTVSPTYINADPNQPDLRILVIEDGFFPAKSENDNGESGE